jgi:DNA-binding transcriptional MerR regulator
MFSIGEFARLGAVTVRSLRHYHELGLVVPAEVDGVTGFRRYSPDQLPRLNRVVALKELGFSLSEIATLTGTVTIDELRGMLILRRTQLERDLDERGTQLRQIEARLAMIEEEKDMPRDDIVIKSLPATRVAMIRHPAPGFGGANLGPIIGPGITELYALLSEYAVEVAGQPFVFYEGEPDTDAFAACVAFPIDSEVSGLPSPIEIIDLPAVDNAATLVLAGPGDDTHAKAYRDLARWIEANGYEIKGHGRDVFLNITPPKSDADVVMEAQLPLRRPA